MAILMMIERFPDFLQFMVLEKIIPFSDIINLSQTCKDLHQWIHKSFKAYHMLHIINSTGNYNLLMNANNFYENLIERRLFQIIYRLHKNKIHFNKAADEYYIPILEFWCAESTFHNILYSNDDEIENKLKSLPQQSKKNLWNSETYYSLKFNIEGVNRCSKKKIYISSCDGNIDMLNWWLNAALKYPNSIQFKHSKSNIDNASYNGRINILDWWLNAALKYPEIITLKYSKNAMDNASYNNHINVLNWWIDAALKYPELITLKYSKNAIDDTALVNRVHILNWWIDAALKYPKLIKLKYSEIVVDYTSYYGSIDILNTWYDTSKKYPHLITFKYSENAINYASLNGQIEILDWWFKSGLIMKYSFKAFSDNVLKSKAYVRDWWKKSGLPTKFTHDFDINLCDKFIYYSNYNECIDWIIKTDLSKQ